MESVYDPARRLVLVVDMTAAVSSWDGNVLQPFAPASAINDFSLPILPVSIDGALMLMTHRGDLYNVADGGFAAPSFPAIRTGMLRVYEPTRRRFIVTGGEVEGLVAHETWEHELGATSWTNRSGAGDPLNQAPLGYFVHDNARGESILASAWRWTQAALPGLLFEVDVSGVASTLTPRLPVCRGRRLHVSALAGGESIRALAWSSKCGTVRHVGSPEDGAPSPSTVPDEMLQPCSRAWASWALSIAPSWGAPSEFGSAPWGDSPGASRTSSSENPRRRSPANAPEIPAATA